MTAALAIVNATVRQLVGRRRFIGLALLAVLPGVLAFFVLGTSTDSESAEIAVGLNFSLFFPLVLPIIALIMATSSLGDERRDQTISFIALRPIPRSVLVAAKIVAAWIAAGALITVGAVAMGGAFILRGADVNILVPTIIGGLVGTLAYAAIFTPLGFLTQRGMLSGLAYVFIWEAGVVGAVSALSWSSLWRIGHNAYSALLTPELRELIPEFAAGTSQPTVGGALIAALVLCVAGTAFLAMRLRRKDLL